ncbi:uncharacterized protein AB675_7916 [Cyphellophora attinorum]|uniref:Uncharacterized protein n=1 Tax=Cyphellophora attinorum TaxID=1664694 RepID=A0A0N1HC12_9EURO|nr:uncharacterized protein AB675_7916 [Phialophora attinorum]KPI41133.1 hypothetical protein AB675_7916 [Phialophora attinorum]
MATVAPFTNGIAPAMNPTSNDVAEYRKILKLRDEVLRGVHPRLNVPAHLAQDVPLLPQLTTQPMLATPSVPQLAVPQTSQRDAQKSPAMPAITPSGINPVLLTKSDDLVRAETGLQRQRLEKALKEQFEHKRLDARKRPAPAEAKADFDVHSILVKATGVSGADSTKDDGEASDSFDENSFYSSRAPDSTPERGAPSPSPGADGARVTDTAAKARIQSAVMGAPLDADADDEYSPRLARRDSPAYSPALDPEDEEEEGEYSPPEAVEGDSTMQDVSATVTNVYDPRSRQLRRYSEVDNGNVRIVRNHIISPVAPQPSRISPLALAKQPPSQQNTQARRDRSPDYVNPRKKRKLDKRDRMRRRNGSPGVKEENVSPPPFHEVQPLGSGRLPASNPDRPIVIDETPRDVRYAPVEQQFSSPRVARYAEPEMPLSEPRVVSRQAMRPMRDTQDLRRVASMHNVRAEMGDDHDTFGPSSRPRVASYRESSPVIHRQPLDDPYDRQIIQEVRVSRTPAPMYREAYPEEQIRYEPMPPPQQVERIV